MCARESVCAAVTAVVLFASASEVRAQATINKTRWVAEVGVGIDLSINGNVNSGVIGTLQGQTAAILPNSYGEVYGTGIQFRFGGGFVWDELTEFRGVFTWQSADANLVRMGDLGPSNLYGQYTDYKSLGLDLGVRRYLPLPDQRFRVYGELTLGASFVDAIDVKFAAPQSNLVFTNTDFYDQSGAFSWTLGVGALFPMAAHIDATAQIGIRRVGALPPVGPLVGTDLEDIADDSARLTLPITVGVRFKF